MRRSCFLADLSLEEYREFSRLFDEDVFRVLDPRHVVDARSIRGGTGTAAVRAQLARAVKWLAACPGSSDAKPDPEPGGGR
ncbi:MAG: hypothetical protein QJR01_07955 [Kyrpidia sp.]|nr:hypothetical protein [Kyrpidia sp.]